MCVGVNTGVYRCVGVWVRVCAAVFGCVRNSICNTLYVGFGAGPWLMAGPLKAVRCAPCLWSCNKAGGHKLIEKLKRQNFIKLKSWRASVA